MEKMINIAKFCFLTGCLLQMHSTYAIPATITPLDPILPVGSNVNITCTLDRNQTTHTAGDIIWIKNYFSTIDSSIVDIISDSEAMISLQNLTRADSGDSYFCRLPEDSSFYDPFQWVGTSLHVGSAPTAPTLQCFSTNLVDYWCEWSKVENTNLVENYTFQFEYPAGTWTVCPEYVNDYKCNVPMSDDDGNALNPGVNHQVRVIVQNYLGKATTPEKNFWPEMEAVPKPPVVENADPSPTTLRVKFGLSEELISYAKSSLLYHFRYSSSDSPSTWTEDSDLNNRDDEVTITGLDYYTLYNLQVRAQFTYNSWSEWGPTYQARTNESAPEGAVTFTVTEANIGNFVRDIFLHWTTFSEEDLNGHLDGYHVTLWESDTVSKVDVYSVDANAVSYIINDLTLYEEFYVSVVAYNSVGETRQDKNQILDKTDEPGIPTGLDGEVLSSNSINVSWTVPDDPGSITLTYELKWYQGGQVKIATINVNAQEEPTVSYLVTDLEAYTEYEFQVRAGNDMGYGQYSNVIERTFESVPGNISTLLVNPVEQNATMLSVSWSEPDQPNGAITKYILYYQQYPYGSVHNVSLTPEQETPHLLGNLQAYETYMVWMTASNSAGEGAVGQNIIQTTSQGTPSAPQNVSVSQVNSTSFTIHWDAPAQTNGVIRHYNVRYHKMNDDAYIVESEHTTQREIVDLLAYTRYEVSVAACSESLADHACGREASPQNFIETLIGVPGPPRDLKFNSRSSTMFEMHWSPPESPNGPIEHYSVVYRHQNMEIRTHQVMDTKFKVNVSCTAKETMNYEFSVKAVNKDEDNNLLFGPEEVGDYDFECDLLQEPTIILYILVPSVFVLSVLLLCYIFKIKYHDKVFIKWPEPKIINVMIDPQLSPPPIEKERFDDLKNRPHSQSSNVSTTSSDQGFHDMSFSLAQIELKTQEQKVVFVNRSHIPSDSLTDDLEDDPFYPQEQDPIIGNEDPCECLENRGLEYFHETYESSMTEAEIQYQRLVKNGSKEALAFSSSNDEHSSRNLRQSESSDEAFGSNTPDIDPYIKMAPTSPTGNNSMQQIADKPTNGEKYANISSAIQKEDENDIENDSVIDMDSIVTDVDDQTEEQPRDGRLLSGDYVTSGNFRVMHQMSDASVDDSSASVINDYSQVEMPNLSEFLENIIVATT